MLSSSLLMPVVLGFHRGAAAPSRGAAIAAVVMIVIIFTTLALGIYSLELYLIAIHYQYFTNLIATIPYMRREPHVASAFIMASMIIMVLLNHLYSYMFFRQS
ncbi:MAG: hypothetical protein QXF78_00950 [Pyrobaculum sp.]|jgi:hypothetical protein